MERDRLPGRRARATGSAARRSGPVAATTPDGSRLHLQHGPIDLIVEAWGEPGGVAEAYRRAWDPSLSRCWTSWSPSCPRCADRSATVTIRPEAWRDAWPPPSFPDRFITPMAAVAGAVADEICEAMAMVVATSAAPTW